MTAANTSETRHETQNDWQLPTGFELGVRRYGVDRTLCLDDEGVMAWSGSEVREADGGCKPEARGPRRTGYVL
jgi:hypothetical protein